MSPAPKLRHCLPLIACVLACAAGAQTAAEPAPRSAYEDVGALEALARAEAQRDFPPLTERQRMVIGPIEPRLELERCHAPVRASLVTPHHMQDRATLEIKCADAKPWHLYVQVRIIGISPAVVAAHAIVAGTSIKESDLRVEERELSQ